MPSDLTIPFMKYAQDAYARDNPQPAQPTIPGMVTPGNIDLMARPVVKNPDGSISTVRSMSVNFGGPEVLIPTVSDDGRILSDDDAIQLYRKSGKHLGMFQTPEHATSYAKTLHEQQARAYGK
jgi:hypothetical protein